LCAGQGERKAKKQHNKEVARVSHGVSNRRAQ
jgi:hypothetical protein